MASSDGMWLFGYGSLIWKPPPHFDERVPGFIRGYVRRFWQASEDHRGVPGAPGRVVTLITHDFWSSLVDNHSATDPEVWGMAYHIPPERVKEVTEYLDIREMGGYTVDYARFFPAEGSHSDHHFEKVLVYIGTPTNPQFVGPEDPEKVATVIAGSTGPSGPNKEYLFELEKALYDLCKESRDTHVRDLASRVRRIQEEQKPEKKKEQLGAQLAGAADSGAQ